MSNLFWLSDPRMERMMPIFPKSHGKSRVDDRRVLSDDTGAAALLGRWPKADWRLADRGDDAGWFREALKSKGIKVCIPGRTSRKKTVKYDKRRYKRRNRIKIMFGRPKDWRRVATRSTQSSPARWPRD